MKRVATYIYITLLTFAGGCRWDDAVRPDSSPWQYTDPGVVGFNEELLIGLDSVLKSGNLGDISSMLVLKDDKLVYENYYLLNARDSLQPAGTMGNGLISLLVGFAIEDGYIGSVEDSIYLYLQEYQRSFDADTLKKAIRFKHLLTMRSGLSWNETLTSPFSAINDFNIVKNSVPDRVAYLLSKPMEAQPGQRYSQNSAAGLLILKAIESQLSGSIEEYLAQKLFRPLEIETWKLEKDEAGLSNVAFGLRMKPLDLMKIGYFCMKQGTWGGRELLSPAWVSEATASQYKVDSFFDIGYLWWKFSDDSGWVRLLPENDAFYTVSDDGQYLFILPSLQLVFLLTTAEQNTNNSNIGYFVLSNYLLQPLQLNSGN